MSKPPKKTLQSMLPGGPPEKSAPKSPDIAEVDIRKWISENAHRLHGTTAADSIEELSPIGDAIAEAVVVGLGETVRSGSEAIHMAHRAIRYLVEAQGFRVLAFQDDESVVAELDAYVRDGVGNLHDLMLNMWRPWQAVEVREALEWVRQYNIAHSSDQIHLLGLAPPAARTEYYDEVLEILGSNNAPQMAQVRALYDVIRTAHDVNEHVQIAHGTHPGGSYSDRARQAQDLIAAAPTGDNSERAANLAEAIADYHGSSLAGDYPKEDGTATVAESIVNYHQLTGRKVIFWEGLAHTMVDKTVTPMDPPENSAVGTKLYHRLGNNYVSLLIAFEHGEIHDEEFVPRPLSGTLDAQLTIPTMNQYVLDLTSPRSADIDEWLRGPHRIRIISGIYDPDHDQDHYADFALLDDMFAAIIRIGEITPSKLLE